MRRTYTNFIIIAVFQAKMNTADEGRSKFGIPIRSVEEGPNDMFDSLLLGLTNQFPGNNAVALRIHLQEYGRRFMRQISNTMQEHCCATGVCDRKGWEDIVEDLFDPR